MRVMAAGSRLTLSRALKVTFSRALARSNDGVDAPDHGVERLVGLGEFTALGLLDRVAEAVSCVLVAEVGQGQDAQGDSEPFQGLDQAVRVGAGDIVLAARAARGDPDRPAVRGGDDLHVPAVVLVLAGPPQVRAVGVDGGHPVGADDRAVQVEVGVPGRRSPLQCGGQVGRVVGEHRQPLVRVAVGGRQRDAVVPGELGQAGVVDQRSTSTACPKTPRVRVPLRVPSSSRCPRSSFARCSAVAPRTASTAV